MTAVESSPPKGQGTIASIVDSVARMLRNSPSITAGDLAALRRMDPRDPSAAFFKIEGLVLDEHLPGEAERRRIAETRWSAIVLGLAHLGDLHSPDRRLGLALAEAGFSEFRFARLLQADADQLLDELPLLARILTAKGISADWSAAARLILSSGRSDEDDTRRHLARDYYGAVARAENA
jgi:CRISPR system Cascade subunit CasB